MSDYLNFIKEKLNLFALNSSNFEIPEFEQEITRLYELMKDGISFKDSISVLVIGPRGSGKTTVINRALFKCLTNSTLDKKFICIRLSGLIHTTDALAAKEVINQLKMSVPDDPLHKESNTGLLFQLLEKLKDSKGRSNLSIVFILEEFDLFASHKNQLLLYNLMDIFHSKESSIILIGTSCRLDVTEILEKRVKSRLSLLQIHLLSRKSFKCYKSLFESLLILPNNFVPEAFIAKWNRSIESIMRDSMVNDILKQLYFRSPDFRQLQQFLMIVLSLKAPGSVLQVKDFTHVYDYFKLDQHQITLTGLSLVEICLLVAMKHISFTINYEPFNFEMVFKEYSKLRSKHYYLGAYDKSVIMKQFNNLVELDVVRKVGQSSFKQPKEYHLYELCVLSEQIMECIQYYPNIPDAITEWASDRT